MRYLFCGTLIRRICAGWAAHAVPFAPEDLLAIVFAAPDIRARIQRVVENPALYGLTNPRGSRCPERRSAHIGDARAPSQGGHPSDTTAHNSRIAVTDFHPILYVNDIVAVCEANELA